MSSVFTKAGILPFLPAPSTENWRFLFMKPVAARPGKGEPLFQLAKGTRMHLLNGKWQDIRDPAFVGAKLEPLQETALREGVEELGLDRAAVITCIELGEVGFTSVRTGEKKAMWLFAAELDNENALLPESSIAPTTAARAWMTLSEFTSKGREDHVAILRQAVSALEPRYGK
jgi:8-oxo-dGTP pyrophosphatase MutT (NUDIX family)